MEHANIEIAQLESAVNEATDAHLRELSDAQLAIIGGGTGEVAFV